MITDKSLLKKRIEQGFIPCYTSGCPRREHCLRWQGREFINPRQLAVTCVNPSIDGNACPMYRSDEKVRMAIGFRHLLDQLPHQTGKALMQNLISVCNRTYAYMHRNGSRPIPPSLQQHITDFCHSHGWQGSVDFDAYEEQYGW